MPIYKTSRYFRVSHLPALFMCKSYSSTDSMQTASPSIKSSARYPLRRSSNARCKITLNSSNGRRDIGTNTTPAGITTPSHGGKAPALHQLPLSLTRLPARAQEPAQLHEEAPHRRRRRRQLPRCGENGRPAGVAHRQLSCKRMRS